MKKISRIALLVLVSIMMVPIPALAEWPDRPITIVVHAAAGGGTDMLTRLYSKLMEKPMNATITNVNRPGAGGALAAAYVLGRPSDGYWGMGVSQFLKENRVTKRTTEIPWETWQYYKCADGIAAWAVKPDSPYKTFADLIKDIHKRPGEVLIGMGGPVGGIWHEATEIVFQSAKGKFRRTHYLGGAPAVLACLQNEIPVVASGLHEQIEFLRAGKLRNLAIFMKEPVTLKTGMVLHPITEFVPVVAKYAPFGAEYMMGFKRDVPLEILQKLRNAFVAAVDSPEFAAFLEKKFFYKNIVLGEDADRMAALHESITSWLLWNLKVPEAKVNPANLGIPKPEDFDSWWPPKGYKPTGVTSYKK